MKKLLVFTLLCMFAASACNKDDRPDPATIDPGVTIGGTTWATRNVGIKGKFVEKPEDYGGYFTFEEAQTACPEGWRLPTDEEFGNLVEIPNAWWISNDAQGLRFRFQYDQPELFLPAAGVHNEEGVLDVQGTTGMYRSSTPANDEESFILYFQEGFLQSDGKSRNTLALSVRCVKK